MSKNHTSSVLLTNLFIGSRTGSELHTLEIAKAFKAEGWDVRCFTFSASYPLLGEFYRESIRVYTPETIGELPSCFDLLFAQHKEASEYIWNMTDIHFGNIVISILGLGTITKHEALPSFADEADLVLFVSEEAKDCASLPKHAQERSAIFPNYATDPFFLSSKRAYADRPQRIAVISNHIPRELHEAGSVAKNMGINFDFYGYETRSVNITPNLLARYDLVVSIGRTAQCCFAAYAPLYCYDHFGGPGYITPDNFEKSAYSNFSGRYSNKFESGEELLADIFNGYSEAVSNLDFLRNKAEERFNFKKLFKKVLHCLSNMTRREITMPSPASDKTKELCLCSLELIRNELKENLATGQIFLCSQKSSNQPPNEEKSIRFPYRLNTEIEISLNDNIHSRRGETIIRFDPDDHPRKCTLYSDGFPANSFTKKGEEDCFITPDPIYSIPSKYSICFSTARYSEKEFEGMVSDKISSLDSNLRDAYSRINALDLEQNSIKATAKRLIRLLIKRATRDMRAE